MTPLVSIVVPNFNHRDYLPSRLESIRAQTLTDFELILLDDASTDGSAEYLKQCANDPGTSLVLNESNSGSPFAQWNKGVQLARGKYVWLAESDDVAQPELLETLVDVLESHPEVVLAESASHRIDESGNDLGLLMRSEKPGLRDRWSENYFAEGESEILETMYVQNGIPSASAVLFRRAIYLKAGLAESSMTIGGDWLQWVKLLCLGERYFHATPLSMSRVHPESQRARTASDGRYELESLRVQQTIRELVHIPPELRREGAERYLAVRLHSVRAGQFAGGFSSHITFFRRLTGCDGLTAMRFLWRYPYCTAIGTAKKLLGRT